MYVTSPIFSRFGQVFQNFWKSRSFSYMCFSPWYSHYLSLIAFGSLCKESKEFDMPKWRNSVQFESQIFGLDFRGEGVKMVKIWFRAFRMYRLWSLRKLNRISVCSFCSRDIRIWKTGPKFPIFEFSAHNSRTRYYLDMRFSPKGAQCYPLNAFKKSKKSKKEFGSNKKTRNFSPNSKTARTRFWVPIFGVKG